MKCLYCNVNVIGNYDVKIVSGQGPAHTECHKNNLLSIGKRSFAGVDLSSYSLDLLNELKELVLMELNSRTS